VKEVFLVMFLIVIFFPSEVLTSISSPLEMVRVAVGALALEGVADDALEPEGVGVDPDSCVDVDPSAEEDSDTVVGSPEAG
jgi:hypothetical protein